MTYLITLDWSHCGALAEAHAPAMHAKMRIMSTNIEATSVRE
jgi:hypothetical protein